MSPMLLQLLETSGMALVPAAFASAAFMSLVPYVVIFTSMLVSSAKSGDDLVEPPSAASLAYRGVQMVSVSASNPLPPKWGRQPVAAIAIKAVVVRMAMERGMRRCLTDQLLVDGVGQRS